MANRYEPGDYLAQFLSPTNVARMYTAKQNAELQRERFEYYKNENAKEARDKEIKEIYAQNVRTWTQIQNFAQEMPFGQQSNFLRKQLDTLPQDFIESQNLNKFIDNYEVIEGNEVDQISMFDNARIEDNPGKIRMTAAQMHDPKRKRQLLSDAKKLESTFFKQKPFNINNLTPTEQRDYKTINGLLSEQEGLLLESTLPGALQNEAMTVQANKAKAGIQMLQKRLEPLLQKGAPIAMPEFNYSPESLNALTDDPDLMSSFLAAPEDDMDAFYNAYKNPDPDPDPDPKLKTGVASIWESYEKETTVPRPGGGFKVVKQTDYRLKSDAPKKYKSNLAHRQDEARLKQMVSDLESRIATIDANIAQIGRVVEKKVVKAGMGPTSIVPIKQGEAAKDKQLKLKRTLEEELEKTRVEYEKIRRPFPEVIRDEQ